MKALLKTPIGRFRIVSLLEGVSFILLMGVAVPAKYVFDNPALIMPVGLVHGILFLLFLAFAIWAIVIYKWKIKTSFLVLLSSVIPFGTFYIDSTILKKIKSS